MTTNVPLTVADQCSASVKSTDEVRSWPATRSVPEAETASEPSVWSETAAVPMNWAEAKSASRETSKDPVMSPSAEMTVPSAMVAVTPSSESVPVTCATQLSPSTYSIVALTC